MSLADRTQNTSAFLITPMAQKCQVTRFSLATRNRLEEFVNDQVSDSRNRSTYFIIRCKEKTDVDKLVGIK